MLEHNKNAISDERANPQPSLWRAVLRSVFGAATRLHRYRDGRDVILGKVLQDLDGCYREQLCCDE